MCDQNFLRKLSGYSVLYAEDDTVIRDEAKSFLENYFADVSVAASGREALERYRRESPDIIITDIEMPGMNGLQLCRTIRGEDRKTPIIVISAYAQTEYLLEAVELGLVKYLIKPVEEEALFGALKRCIDLLEHEESSMIRLTSECRYDSLNATLTAGDHVVHLTYREQRLLELLVRYRTRIVSYTEIENYVYGDKGMSEDALKALVRSLRSKTAKEVICNHAKLGYKIVPLA